MRRLASVRARTTAAATVVFAAALVLAGGGLVYLLRSSMLDNIDTTLELRAADISRLLESGTEPVNVAIADEEDSFVQVVAGDVVVASSENIEGQAPLSRAVSGSVFTTDATPVDESAFRVLIRDAITPSGPVRVLVGNTIENVDGTIATVTVALAIGLPVLLLLAGATTWIVVGWALDPVEAIRTEVSEIGATDLHRRVPQPETDDEIGRLATTMNDMLDRIESGTLRQRQFVSDASHELRTPIAIIRHELEVGLQHPAQTDWPAIADEVLEEDLRMQRLVDDLLWLAKHDQGQPHSRSLLDLDELAAEVAKRNTNRSVVISTAGIGAGQVRANADDLGRVLQNLIDNAIRHARTMVSITVVTTDRGTVELHVDDDGHGVPPELADRIFERFTRGDEARARDEGGAGLGLAIAAEIVAAHNGSLRIARSRQGGARFTAEFPDARV